MQLSSSPITLLTQEFLHVELSAIPADEHGPGNIEVEREVFYDKTDDDWRVTLTVQLIGGEDKEEPPYKGAVVARGYYKVHESYPKDNVEKLVRITGASMLYGAIREMVAYISSRTPNGMINLPSVSFMEPEKTPKKAASTKAKPAKKKAVKKNA